MSELVQPSKKKRNVNEIKQIGKQEGINYFFSFSKEKKCVLLFLRPFFFFFFTYLLFDFLLLCLSHFIFFFSFFCSRRHRHKALHIIVETKLARRRVRPQLVLLQLEVLRSVAGAKMQHNRLVVGLRSPQQRRAPEAPLLAPLELIRADPTRGQVAQRLETSARGGVVHKRATSAVCRERQEGVPAAVVSQEMHRADLSGDGGEVRGCAPVDVGGLHVRTGVEKEVQDGDVAPNGGVVCCGLASGVAHVVDVAFARQLDMSQRGTGEGEVAHECGAVQQGHALEQCRELHVDEGLGIHADRHAHEFVNATTIILATTHHGLELTTNGTAHLLDSPRATLHKGDVQRRGVAAAAEAPVVIVHHVHVRHLELVPDGVADAVRVSAEHRRRRDGKHRAPRPRREARARQQFLQRR
eukprot:PhM_4_TR14084/c3_g1_i2/m.107018